MLVDRRTFLVRKGRWNDAIGLLKEMQQQIHETNAGTMRIYSSHIGPFDTIAWEYETESLTAWERDLDAWGAANGEWFAAWFTRWTEATEPGGALEIWRLE